MQSKYSAVYTERLIRERAYDLFLYIMVRRLWPIVLYSCGLALLLVCASIALGSFPNGNWAVFGVFAVILIVILVGQPVVMIRSIAMRMVRSREQSGVIGKEFGTRFDEKGFWFFRGDVPSFVDYSSIQAIKCMRYWVFMTRHEGVPDIAIPVELIPKEQRALMRSTIRSGQEQHP